MQSFFRDINFEKFTPVLEGYEAYSYIGVIIIVAILTAIVQRAVFLTFDRLGQRHINEIIVPVLVSNTMFENHPKCHIFVILNCSQFWILNSFNMSHYLSYEVFITQLRTFLVTHCVITPAIPKYLPCFCPNTNPFSSLYSDTFASFKTNSLSI